MSSRTQFLVLVCFSCMTLCVYANCCQVLYVIPNDANGTDCPSANISRCHTLNEFAGTSSDAIQSDVELQFLPGKHSLESTMLVSNITDVSLKGVAETPTITCKGTVSGLLFMNVTNVTVENLTFIKCGAPLPHDQKLQAAVALLYSANVTLNKTTIFNSNDAGFICINVSSYLTLLQVNVSNSGLSGNMILFEKSVTYPSITVNNSVFVNNSHHFHEKDLLQKGQRTYLLQRGLTIYINHCAARISMYGNTFSNNSRGGNLALVLQNITNFTALDVRIGNSTIEGGYSVRGGGLYLSVTKQLNLTKGSPVSTDKIIIVIEGVEFYSNIAKIFGAGMYLDYKNSPNAIMHKRIILRNCNFSRNYVKIPKHGGIALHSNEYTIAGSYSQITPEYRVELSKSWFHNNGNAGTWREPGNPAILVNSNKYFGIFDVTVTDNDCNGIIAVGSNLVFGGNVVIANNRGASGGGMLLCQNAIMYLHAGTTITIHSNHVQHAGGGISVEDLCLQTRPPCFFQFITLQDIKKDIETIKIHLHNNSAEYAGRNLFGGNVDYCYMKDSPAITQPSLNNMEVFNKLFLNLSNTHDPHSGNSTRSSSSVTSIPRHICFCDRAASAGGTKDCSHRDGNISVYPGEKFHIPVTVVGQLDGEIPGSVRVWLQNPHKYIYKFLDGEQVQKVGSYCKDLTYTFSSNLNYLVIKLGVENTGDISGYERSSHFLRRNFKVSFKECPPGFKLVGINASTTKYRCDCAFKAQLPGVYCNITEKSITKDNGKRWIGYDRAKIEFSEVCPFGYCKNSKVVMNVLEDKPDKQCAYNRTGILCGGCIANHSAVLGSVACRKCSNDYLSLILVFALAGLLLVAMLTLLNLTISQGTLSGLIFYVNVIESNYSSIFPTEDAFPTGFLKVFISWLNLDAGIETCFYNGMDTYAKVWLHFVFPIYNWFIAIVIILLCRKFNAVAKIAGRNAVNVLATLILLSYTNFIESVIDVFSYAKLDIQAYNGTDLYNPTRWLFDANVLYFGFRHSMLFSFAFLSGLICFPFTLLLLMIKPLHRLPHKGPGKLLHRLKPFLDAYTGPYTNHGRFWPGMLLAARIGLSATGKINILNSYNAQLKVVVGTVLCLLAISSQVRFGLYRVHFLNTLESLFLWNLSILALGTMYFREQDQHHKTLFDVMVGSAFIGFLAIFLYHVWLRMRGCCQFITHWASRRQRAGLTGLNCYPPKNDDHEPLT